MYFLFIQYIFYFIHVRNIDKYLYQNESSPRNHDKFELSQRESFLVLTKKNYIFVDGFGLGNHLRLNI